MTDHPPKPRLTLRVGITGHRPNKLSNADLPRIERQLRDTFATIEAAVAKAYEANKEVYASGPADAAKPYRIRLVSGFAEGADQMAVAACPADWTVEAVLPFPKDEYLKDFAQSAAGDGRDVRREFETSLKRAAVVTEVADAGCGLAGPGLCRLRRLYAPSNRRAGRRLGRPGAEARRYRRHCTGGVQRRHPGDLDRHRRRAPDRPDRIIPERQASSIDRGMERADRTGGARSHPCGAFVRFVRLPAFTARTARSILRRELAAGFPRVELRPAQAMGQRPAAAPACDSPEPLQALETNFNKLVDEAPDAGALSQRLKDVLAPRHAWADSLAVYFSHRYRNAYVLCYLLAALAVLIAVLGAYVENPIWKSAFVGVELLVIVVIIRLVRYGSDNAWHERWIDYRLVAESLRHARYLAYVSEFGLVQQKEIRVQPWTIWYIRATLRELGLPNAVLDRAYQRPLLQSMLRHEVQAQRHWHEINTDVMHRIDHFLHRWANGCFYLTLVALAFGLAALIVLIAFFPSEQGAYWLKWAKPLLLLFAAGLPALGAALTGIRVQGGFDDSKERSEHMIAELNALEAHCDAVLRQQPQLTRTADTLIETVRVMSEDLAAWQELYGRKRLNLPA